MLISVYFRQLIFCWKTLVLCEECLLLVAVLPTFYVFLLGEKFCSVKSFTIFGFLVLYLPKDFTDLKFQLVSVKSLRDELE